MYTLILSRHSEQTALIQNLLRKENCKHKVASVLSGLEREIRIEFPDFLLVDQNYFSHEQANMSGTKDQCPLKYHSYFTDIISPLNTCFPIFFFDSKQNGFIQYYVSEYQKSILPPNTEITLLLAKIKDNINTFIQSSQNQFRPAEKKLYLLLKAKNNQAMSLVQMAESLWGCSTSAHIKTLYSYIHRIKHILEKNEYSPERLIKEKKGYYKLAIRKT